MNTVLKYLSIIFLTAMAPIAAKALPATRYTDKSVLAEGRWVKIAVDQTGMQLLTPAMLRQWGFTDPSKVRIYGYGGRRIADYFTADNYVDDLPMVQCETTAKGIVFYGVATDTRIEVDAYSDRHYISKNPYSNAGYYFLTDREAPLREIPVEGRTPEGETVKVFTEGLFHEIDELTPMQSGHVLLGEDFRLTPSRTFKFEMPGRIEGTPVWMQCDFYANSSGVTSLAFTANGTALASSSKDQIRASDEEGDSCRVRKVFTPEGNTLTIGITARSAGAIKLAALDNLAVCYSRSLTMPAAGVLRFSIAEGSPELAGATSETRVWDITDITDITALPFTTTQRGAAWRSDYFGRRHYVAWNPTATGFLTPRLASQRISNQNIHGCEIPDMVIVTLPELLSDAERIAAMHRAAPDSLEVLVVTAESIYNEFASGSADVNAIRRMMKMFYDRSKVDAAARKPGYLLLLGGVSYDHRRLTSAWRNSSALTLPTWQTDGARSESYSYCSDDPITFLEDNSGLINGRDVMCVAVGRIPARTVAQSKRYVDHLLSYNSSPAAGEWRNRVVLLADDGDNGIHQSQSDDFERAMRSNGDGNALTYRKVYLNTYPVVGGAVPLGREKLHSLLNDGVIMWSYIGHGSSTALTAEGVYTIKDINENSYRNPPFFYGATCTFVRWDSNEEAALQVMTLGESSSLIGGISAVRPVLIARNGPFGETFGTEVFTRSDDGRFLPIGESLRRAKNRTLNEDNKLRYVMLGDPAMRLAIPNNIVTLDSIAGRQVSLPDDEEEPAMIHAMERTRLSGRVTTPSGSLLTDFNGFVDITLYDAEVSYSTVRNDLEVPLVTDEQGERIFAGRTPVKNGLWEIDIVLPTEIADNYRPATLSLFARADGDPASDASGVNRDFYVYGIANSELTDVTPPEIEYIYLNHDTFRPGDTVNGEPMLLARISDNLGLNMSTNGVGHQMTFRIDGTLNFTDLASSYTPDADGSPSGTIAYQLPALKAGNHTGVLKVWDVAGNSSSAEIDFFVDPNAAPKIFDVYTDANPATIEANFYINHNRPDAMLTVTIEIFDISGRRVWTKAVRGRADMFATAPVNWNLTDSVGRKVTRGIYLYKATVTTDATADSSGLSSSAVRRIAVAPL